MTDGLAIRAGGEWDGRGTEGRDLERQAVATRGSVRGRGRSRARCMAPVRSVPVLYFPYDLRLMDGASRWF